MKRTITLRYLFTLCVMTLVSAFCGGNLALAEEVTLTGSDLGMASYEYLTGKSFTASGVKFSVGGTGSAQYNSTIRIYSGNTFTIEMVDGMSKITKIKFSSTSTATYISANIGSYSNHEWTSGGDAVTSVVFTATGSYRFSNVTITYEAASVVTKQDVTLSMPESASIDLLETFDAAASLTVPDGGAAATGAITYSVEPATGDFTIDSETGLFTAGKTNGSYTIKASFAGDENYNMAEAYTTVTVNSRVWAVKNYKHVTDASQIVEGGQYLLVYADGSYFNVMSTFSTSDYNAANALLSYENYKIGDLMSVGAEYAGKPIVLEAVGDNNFALKTDQGYLRCDLNYNEEATYGLNVSVTSASQAAQWTIEIDAEGNAHIKNVYAPTFELYFYKGWSSNFFLAREADVNSYTPQLYAKCADMSFKVQALGYATYAVDFAYQMPAGVTGYAISGLKAGEENKLQKVEAYTAGQLVPALTPLLVHNANVSGADETAYPILVNKEVDASYEGDNYLEYKRNAENMTASQQAVEVYYYKLTKNTSEENYKPLGFYWGATGGAAFAMNNSSSAYLAPPKSLSFASGLLFDEAGEATGIQLTSAEETAAPAVYNLQGVRVSGKLAKGLYIVNGKKVLVK